MAPLEHCYEGLFVFLWVGHSSEGRASGLEKGVSTLASSSRLGTALHVHGLVQRGTGPSLSLGTEPVGEAVPVSIGVALG